MQKGRRFADQHSDKPMMTPRRVLLSALIFSAVWHLFWLSALTVVSAPVSANPAKFSSVSFLGPILEESVLRVSAALHERSALEKRYFSEIKNSSVLVKGEADLYAYTEAGLEAGADIFKSDEELTALWLPAIDGDKIEPGNFQ